MDTTSYVYTPFVAKRHDGPERLIAGPISANMIDLDQQLVDPEFLKSALPAWMVYGNIREQHNPLRPVGKAQSLDASHPVGPYIVAKIADDECWNKIQAGVFSGFSVGIKNARISFDGRAPRGTIVGGDIFEVSVVDHPSARKAAFSLVTKNAGGWRDNQTGITLAAFDPQVVYSAPTTGSPAQVPGYVDPAPGFTAREPVNKAAAPQGESATERIIRLAMTRELPGNWKDTPAMGQVDIEQPAFSTPAVEKGAKPDNKDDRKEDGDDEEDEDDFSCPRCGKDARGCECYRKTETKAAAPDFESEHSHPRPINAGHPSIKGEAKSIHAYAAQHEGPEGAHAPFDSSDAVVRLDYTIRKAEHLFNRMEAALDGLNSAGFSPNNTASNVGHVPANDPNYGMGGTPASAQDWHGTHATTANLQKKSPDIDAETVYKIAANVAQVAIRDFFADNTIIKGTAPDSAQAALVDLVKSVTSQVVYDAFDQLEGRLAKVEDQPRPSKGVAAVREDRHFQNLPNASLPIMEAELAKMAASLPDEQQTALARELFTQEWSRAANPPQ